MSDSFLAFHREHCATGIERCDGYTFSNFDSMTLVEKEQAADMLSGELQSFYAAADALAYLDPARCENEIRKALSAKTNIERNRASHLYFVLWNITGDKTIIDQLVAIGRSGQVDFTAFLSDLAKLPGDDKVLALIEDIIKQHPCDRAVEQAANQLIDRYDVLLDGEICNPDSIELMRSLTSHVPTEKQGGLLKLKTEFKARKA